MKLIKLLSSSICLLILSVKSNAIANSSCGVTRAEELATVGQCEYFCLLVLTLDGKFTRGPIDGDAITKPAKESIKTNISSLTDYLQGSTIRNNVEAQFNELKKNWERQGPECLKKLRGASERTDGKTFNFMGTTIQSPNIAYIGLTFTEQTCTALYRGSMRITVGNIHHNLEIFPRDNSFQSPRDYSKVDLEKIISQYTQKIKTTQHFCNATLDLALSTLDLTKNQPSASYNLLSEATTKEERNEYEEYRCKHTRDPGCPKPWIWNKLVGPPDYLKNYKPSGAR